MSKIKLNLKYLSVSDKVQFARQIITSMTGNVSFPAPDPPLATITSSANEVEKAFNDASIAKQEYAAKLSVQSDKVEILDANLRKLANYIESASDNDATIQSAGMSVRAKPASIGNLPIPAGLSAEAGAKEGEIDISWDRVEGARSYVVEQSADPITQTSWRYAGVSTKSSMTISGLTSGVKYWFRVAGVGAAGRGPWSDPATKYAP